MTIVEPAVISSASKTGTVVQRLGDLWLLAQWSALLYCFWSPTILMIVSGLLVLRLGIRSGAQLLGYHLVTAWLLATFVAPVFRAKPQGYLTSCKCNLVNLASLCEMYSVDHEGHYPSSLQQLTPRYVESIPTCPMAGQDSYTDGYVRSRLPEAYSICCSGIHHKNTDITLEGYPSYNNRTGLTER